MLKLFGSTSRYGRLLRTFGEHRSTFWLCTAASKPTKIPDEIRYPNGDKKLKQYLDRLKDDGNQMDNGKNVQIISSILKCYENRLSIVDEYTELSNEMANETENEILSMANDEKQKYSEILAEIDEEMIENVILLNDDYEDVNSLMLEIQAGIGGQEAMLFAREIFQMYCNYLNYKDWDHDILEENNSDLGGIRSGSIVVRDGSAYETLKYEAGVHRVQRVPKTEKGGRIHTSTAVVTVIPCANEIQININPGDLRIETKRSSAPGGQNVNKLESAVRIVHIPTGMAVECQEERTQVKNKSIAMKKLYSRLYQIEFAKQDSSEKSMRKSQIGSRTRNEKLRTYNYPNNRVTDHRLGSSEGTVHNLDEFLLGNEYLDNLIVKVYKFTQKQKLNEMLDSQT